MSTTTRRLHERAMELAAGAIDFALGADDAAELQAHLAGCPACTRSATALRTDAAAIRLPALRPSRRVDDAVYAAIARRDARTSPRVLVLAAAALLLVALLGVAAAGAFLRVWPTLPIVVEPTAPAVVVVPTQSPTPAPAWQAAAIPPMFADGSSTPAAVTVGGDAFVAVGGRAFRDNEAPSGGTASAWRSPDGLAWEPATSGADLAVGDVIPTSGPEAGLVDVAWGPPGFVAVGIALEDGVVGGAWHSGDGLTWTRSGFPDSTLARPTAVTWDGSNFIVVGVVEDQGSPRAAVWLSADGRSWRRVPDGDAFDIGGYIDTGEYRSWGGPADVTSSVDGSIYAVGGTCAWTAGQDTYPCSPFVVRSVDGEAWSTVPVPDASGFAVVLASVAATRTHVVAVSGGQGEGVVVGDEAGWRQIERRGEVPLYRVIAFGEGFLALSTDGAKVSLWTSVDGEAWTAVPGVPQPPDVNIIRAADLTVAGGQVVIVGWAELSSAAGIGGFAIVGFPQQSTPAPPTPTGSPPPPASPPPSAVPTPVAGTLPVASGVVRTAPGPDGGVYVVVSDTGSGSVVSLLTAGGTPRPGWPVKLDGWDCDAPNGPLVPVVASDGSVRVVCMTEALSDGVRAFAFDPSGRFLPGWPVDLPVNAWEQPRIVGDQLFIAAHESSDQEPYPGAYWLLSIAPDGTVRTGARYEIATDAGGWPVAIGPEGIAYRSAAGEITAFDLDGVRAGWPVRVEGMLSGLAFGPDGRIYLTSSADGSGTSRLLAFDRDGRAVPLASEELPFVGASAWSGAGPDGRPLAPLVAGDGTVFVVGEAEGHAMVAALGPSGTVKAGWPHQTATLLQWQGTCPGDVTGCGAWRSVPVVAPDGAIYLPLAAPDAQIGGSLAAVGPDGQALPGWPMHLARRGAEFWSVVVGSDGTVYALAIEPEAGGKSSATILAIAKDGTVRSRTTVVEP
jgi:hypothetical protein